MKARFNVKPEVNKAGEAPIRVSLFIRGTRMMQSIGFTIDPKQWNQEKQCVAKSYKNKAGHTGIEINSRISKITDHFQDYELTLSEAPTTAQLATELKKVIYSSDVQLAAVHTGDKNLASLQQKTKKAKEEAEEKTAPSAYSYVDEYL